MKAADSASRVYLPLLAHSTTTISFLHIKNLQERHPPCCGPRWLFRAHYKHLQKTSNKITPGFRSFGIASRILSIRIRNETEIGTTQTAIPTQLNVLDDFGETSIFGRHLCTAGSLRDSAGCEFRKVVGPWKLAISKDVRCQGVFRSQMVQQ